MHRSANPYARSRETSRPSAKGDGRSWPLTPSPILHYRHNFQLPCLIDTGSEISVLPATLTERQQQQPDFNLVAVNGGSISTFGKHSLTLNMGLRRTFRYLFQVRIWYRECTYSHCRS